MARVNLPSSDLTSVWLYLPPEFKKRRYTLQENALKILKVLTMHGFATRQDVIYFLTGKVHDNGLHRAFRFLAEIELIVEQKYQLSRQASIGLIQLSEKGCSLVRSIGWEPAPSEWQKLLDHHEGARQEDHMVAVVRFALAARVRNIDAVILPETDDPYFAPDVALNYSNNPRPFYVEVERYNHSRAKKWRTMEQKQTFVAVCASTEAARINLVREIKRAGVASIYATDLQTLTKDAHNSFSKLSYILWAEIYYASQPGEKSHPVGMFG